ncbi:MAG: ferredoxin [Spirochaetales bacterium]|nr:ferredoxin [Spirochaetales bacterium]
MRLSIDISRCIGCGLCEETLPGVVVTGMLTARVVNPEIPAYLAETARELVEYCPAEALSIEKDAT